LGVDQCRVGGTIRNHKMGCAYALTRVKLVHQAEQALTFDRNMVLTLEKGVKRRGR
jgi:hypothetical protein